MQTFICDHDLYVSAKILDNQRLGKQRVEANQIASTLLGLSSGWKNHPAVKMWKGYEGFLVHIYNRIIMDEWIRRGYDNKKSEERWTILRNVTVAKKKDKPEWINDEFIESHRSNLIRKNPDYYEKLWPGVSPDLPYIWPS